MDNQLMSLPQYAQMMYSNEKVVCRSKSKSPTLIFCPSTVCTVNINLPQKQRFPLSFQTPECGLVADKVMARHLHKPRYRCWGD